MTKNNDIRYLKLTDSKSKNVIVKQQGRKFFGFVDGQWVRRGINIGYFLPEAPEYDCYEEISEAEAMNIS